jgi:SAM-dependent methyltransferase
MTSQILKRWLWKVWSALPGWVRRLVHAIPGLGRLTRSIGLRTATYQAHDNIYGEGYYKNTYENPMIAAQHIQSGEMIAMAVVSRFGPASIADVGCGNGNLLLPFHQRGLLARGLEYSSAAIRICEKKGLTVNRFDLERDVPPADFGPFDVVMSFEVAEHIPEPCSDRYVDTLCVLAQRWVLLTAAVPGQIGEDHVNEQPNEYWIKKLQDRGFRYDVDLTTNLRKEWKTQDLCHWYYENLLVFERSGKANAG